MEVMYDQSSDPPYSDLPIVMKSWGDTQEFIRRLNARTGKKFRLPTEAEWEYAARAGTKTSRYWGEEIGFNNANCVGCGSRWDDKSRSPVKSFPPNAFRLYDMLGNVYNWTCSEYKNQYDGSEKRCTANAKLFSLRGGSWNEIASHARAAHRKNYEPSRLAPNFGFRLAQD